MKNTFILLFTLTATLPAAPLTNRLENLTLDQAIALAERQHPDLAEARARAEAAAGRARQAGQLPNPELVGGMESAPFRGDTLGQAEYVGGVAQTIPLNRRLSKARAAEQLEGERLRRELEVKRRQLHRRVHSAFAAALYQERAMRTQGDLLSGAEKAVALAETRVRAGDAIPEDIARAELEAARVKAESRRSQTLREQALVALSGAMGMPGIAIGSLRGELEVAFEIPTLEALASSLETNPVIAAATADVAAHAARLTLAQAERVPDLKVEALYRRLEGVRENSFDVGFSIPLPLFDGGRGRLRAARAELEAAEARSRSTQIQLSQRLRAAYLELTTALADVRVFRDEILPHAGTVLKTAEARHQAGDASLSDLLPVRRDWGAVQLSYLESLRAVMQAWAEVKSLAGPS